MKLTIFIVIVIGCLQVSASGYAQKITLSVKDVPLENVFKQLKKQSGYLFWYENSLLSNTKNININVKNATLRQVLDECFKEQPLSYDIVGNTIVIKGKELNRSLEREIKGIVSDSVGIIPGVSVKLKGESNIGTVTDEYGRYSLRVLDDNAILVFSMVGYVTQEIAVKDLSVLNVLLKAASNNLDDVVVVAFGTQKKVNVTGAVSSITNKQLKTTTTPNLTNMLAGKLPGVRVVQRSSEPGTYNSSFDIRGFGNPLIIVDGVPSSDFNKLNPNDIESVSVLKDASAAVYGVRAANGVVLVTTKRGKAGETQLNYTSTIGWSTPTNYPQGLDAYQFETLTNEADFNAGRPTPSYSKEDLQKFKDGTTPSTDWYGLVAKRYIPQMQHNLSASGGTEKVKYFFSIGYYDDEGMWKSGDLKDRRYNFRSNVTAQITKNLKAQMLLSGIMDKTHFPIYTSDQIISGIWTQLRNLPAYTNNNPNYLNNFAAASNPLATTNSDISGYTQNDTKSFSGTLALDYTFPFVDGLQAKIMYSYDPNYSFQKRWAKSYDLYNYDTATDTYIPVTYQSPSTLYQTFNTNYSADVQASLNYKKTFAEKHNLQALFLFEQTQSASGSFNGSRQFTLDAVDQMFAGNSNNTSIGGDIPNSFTSANEGLVGRLNYNYSDKYFLEGSFRYDGSSKFAEGHQWGLFPAVSAGWRISEESFIKDNIPSINNLKIRASWGKLGDDAASTYQFLSGYNYPSGNYILDNAVVSGLVSRGMANHEITWFTATTTDIGLDADLWNGKLTFTADAFKRKETGKLGLRNLSLPATVGAALPQENLNSILTQGIELQLGHADKIGGFNYNISGNISFTRTKNLYVERAASNNSDVNWRQNNSDRWNDILWGYGVIGQFTSQDDINNSPTEDGQGNRTLFPGDIKYEDYNNDGIIDDSDIHPIGRSSTNYPEVNFGMTLNIGWKGFDLNLLLQGATRFNVNYGYSLVNPLPWGRNGIVTDFMDRWHHEDLFDPNSPWIPGKYPSTRAAGTDPVNHKTSTFWYHDASYLRLKSIELGYTLPAGISKKIGLRDVRVFTNGFNLFTWTKLKFIDPEHPTSDLDAGYPITKNYNVGLNITF